MKITFDIYATIILFGIVQGLFLSIVLFRLKRGNKKANRILSLFLLVASYSVFAYWILQSTNLYYYLPHLLGTSLPLLYIFGPLFFLYIKALTSANFSINKKYLLHFIPSCVCLIYMMPYYVTDAKTKIDLFLSSLTTEIIITDWFILWLLAIVHIWIYIIAIKIMLRRHYHNIQQNFSNIDKISLNWINYLLFAFIICWAFILLVTLIDIFILQVLILNALIPIIVSLGIFFVGYRGMLQQNIFNFEISSEQENKYKKSTLSAKMSQNYLQKLNNLMQKEKPYTDPDLTLPGLAKQLDIPRNDLSQVINTHTGQNFYDFINSYRVHAIKKLIEDPKKKHLTLLSLALEAGFNSKATFNTAFKKHTKLTPSQYKNRLEQEFKK